jgi:tRNA(adenine34) deaminase
MAQAIIEAQKADVKNEVPVGAVVVLDGKIIGRGYNQPISSCDPCAHAEVLALRDAAKNIQNYRLSDATLYVTIEPCTMCSGAIIHSRVAKLVYGATEPKAGVVESQELIFEKPYFNHTLEVVAGVMADECTEVIQAFFKRRREEKKAEKLAKRGDA